MENLWNHHEIIFGKWTWNTIHHQSISYGTRSGSPLEGLFLVRLTVGHGDWGLAGTSEHPKISLLKMMKFLIRMFTWLSRENSMAKNALKSLWRLGKKLIWYKCCYLVGELHLVVSLRNGTEVGGEADGDVVRVHLGDTAVLRQVRQQGEQEGHHLTKVVFEW